MLCSVRSERESLLANKQWWWWCCCCHLRSVAKHCAELPSDCKLCEPYVLQILQTVWSQNSRCVHFGGNNRQYVMAAALVHGQWLTDHYRPMTGTVNWHFSSSSSSSLLLSPRTARPLAWPLSATDHQHCWRSTTAAAVPSHRHTRNTSFLRFSGDVHYNLILPTTTAAAANNEQ